MWNSDFLHYGAEIKKNDQSSIVVHPRQKNCLPQSYLWGVGFIHIGIVQILDIAYSLFCPHFVDMATLKSTNDQKIGIFNQSSKFLCLNVSTESVKAE